MSHTFHQLYYHFIWATHARDPLIDRGWRPQMLNIINEEVKNKGGLPIRHNAMPDHVHLLVRLPPKIAPSDFRRQGQGRHFLSRQSGAKSKIQIAVARGVRRVKFAA